MPSVDRQVIRLEDAGEPALFPLVGGKASNLGAMGRSGLPVPGGFCVSTDVYAMTARLAGIPALVAGLRGESADLAGPRLDAIRAALLTAALEPASEASIHEAYSRLGESTPVAVRSSATAEDLPGASFAGAQDTFLNVIGPDRLLEAIRRCWASLWSPRSFAYRSSSGVDPFDARIAVVVQRMVRSAASGVLFTANPLTGSRRETVLDASYGLGEAVVSGIANPDHFVVASDSGEIVERRRGDKLARIVPLEGGGTGRVEAASAEDFCLSDGQVLALARIGGDVERLFGGPQDIEWAYDETGKLWLTQARPITALFPLPAGAPAENDELRLYYSINASQGMESPFTPMGGSLLRLLVSGVTALLGSPPADPFSGPGFLHEAGGRLFLDVTAALRNRFGRPILKAMSSAAEARVGSSIDALAADPRFALIRGSPLKFVFKALSFVLGSRIPLYAIQSLASPGPRRGGSRKYPAPSRKARGCRPTPDSLRGWRRSNDSSRNGVSPD